MEFDYLQIEDVIELHDMALRDFGGLPGVDIGNLEAKLALPMSVMVDLKDFQLLKKKLLFIIIISQVVIVLRMEINEHLI